MASNNNYDPANSDGDPTRLYKRASCHTKVFVPLLIVVATAALGAGQSALFSVVVDGSAMVSPPVPPPGTRSQQMPPAPPLTTGFQEVPGPDSQAAAQLAEAQGAAMNPKAAVVGTAHSRNQNGDEVVPEGWKMPQHPEGRRLLGSRLRDGINSAARGDMHMHPGDPKPIVIQSYNLIKLGVELWERKQILLALSLFVFCGIWPVFMMIVTAASWVSLLHPEIRQGISIALQFLAKWTLLDVVLLVVWLPLFKFEVPNGQVRLLPDWGSVCFCAGFLISYLVLLIQTGCEAKPRPASPKVSSRHSAHFHGVFFTLAAVTTLLLCAALTLPAYTSKVDIHHTDKNGVAQVGSVDTEYTLLVAGQIMYDSGGASRWIGIFYMVLVTTMPGVFLVSATVAWVTSPLERAGDESTNSALFICDMCGRLVSLDVWLYVFIITYMKLDEITALISKDQEYRINVSIEVHLAVYCALGCVMSLWMMHALVQYAHSPHTGMSGTPEEQKALTEPVFAPPTDLVMDQMEGAEES